MDNYDPDLILDLAAGLLPVDEARTAEAGLSAEGRAELEAQRAVLAAIAAAPPAAMTDIERAQFHRSVAVGIAETTRELSPVEVATPKAATQSRRPVVWMRWASAAAVAAVFLGVVGVASQLSSPFGSSDSADVTTVAALATTTTTFGDAALSATTQAAAPAAGGDGAEDAAETVNADTLEPAKVRSQSADEDLATLAAELQTAQRFSGPLQDVTALACYSEAIDELVIVDWSLATYIEDDGTEIEAIGYAHEGSGGDGLNITLYDVSTCQPIVTAK